MKRHSLETILIYMALSYLASCVTVGGSMSVAGNSKEDGRQVKQAAGSVSLGSQGIAAAGGMSTTSQVRGTRYALLTSDQSSEAHRQVQEQLLKYRNMELKNEKLDGYLRSTQEYNNSLVKENTNLRKDIDQIKKDKIIAKMKLLQAETRRDGLKLVKKQLNDSLKGQEFKQSEKKRLQDMLITLDKENKKMDGIITELQNISKGESVIIGGD